MFSESKKHFKILKQKFKTQFSPYLSNVTKNHLIRQTLT